MSSLPPAAAYGLMEAATVIGSYVWWERRCFEVLGGWTVAFDDPVTKAMVDRHAAHHAWRAAQWWDRLPVLAQIDRTDLVVAPPNTLPAMMVTLGQLTSPLGRLAGAYRVAMPRLATGYRSHLARISAVADGPTIRTLTMVLADIDADWREGEAGLQQAMGTPAETFAAGYTVARLEAILLGASPATTLG